MAQHEESGNQMDTLKLRISVVYNSLLEPPLTPRAISTTEASQAPPLRHIRKLLVLWKGWKGFLSAHTNSCCLALGFSGKRSASLSGVGNRSW